MPSLMVQVIGIKNINQFKVTLKFVLTENDDHKKEEVDDQLPNGGSDRVLPVEIIIHVLCRPNTIKRLKEGKPAALWYIILSLDNKWTKIFHFVMSSLILAILFLLVYFLYIIELLDWLLLPGRAPGGAGPGLCSAAGGDWPTGLDCLCLAYTTPRSASRNS